MDIVTDAPESELLQALQAALEALEQPDREPGTITAGEFAEALGMGHGAAARRLKRLMAAGVVEAAMVQRTDAWNITRHTQGYRLVAK